MCKMRCWVFSVFSRSTKSARSAPRESASIPSAFYENGRQYYLNFRFKY